MVAIAEEATPMAMATIRPATSTVPFTGQPHTTLKTVVLSSKPAKTRNINRLITSAAVALDNTVSLHTISKHV